MNDPFFSDAFSADTNAPDGQKLSCRLERVADPVGIVIFGASGDLTARKLFPAIARLCEHRTLPERFYVVGVARSDMGQQQFCKAMRTALEEHAPKSLAYWAELEHRIRYVQVASYDSPESYAALKKSLEDLEQEFAMPPRRLFYLAVPPAAYPDISRNLGRAGLASPDREKGEVARLVIEKPFGHDLQSARELNAAIHEYFQEDQIFRIDHYLAKETVQNILLLRFANAMFEPLWNRNYIHSIRILAAESLGVGHRAGYYDQAGVLRDMFQNHMMQLLALCTMEPPSCFEAELVRDEKSKVYRAMRPFPVRNINEHLVLGQYASGELHGEGVRAYREESGVRAESLTPTYAAMKVYVDNWRWQGVPIYMVSGKRLAEKRTEIVIQFKEVPFSMFRKLLGAHISANHLILGIYPREEVSLTFQAKVPGPMCLRTAKMHFDYNQGYSAVPLDAYSKVFLDCMLGDSTLFWRQDGVELCWNFLTPVLVECDCPEQAEKVRPYAAGSWGPEDSGLLFQFPDRLCKK